MLHSSLNKDGLSTVKNPSFNRELKFDFQNADLLNK